MTFLAPLLAGMSVLGAVPVAIWLLNRNRYRVVEWPALEFLLRTLERSSRRVQLRELLLLVLRTLAVVLMALALARPTVAGAGLALWGGGVQVVVVLDHSLSMACRVGDRTRLDLAKDRARELVGHLPRGSSAALVLMSDVATTEIAEPSQDLAYVAQAITNAPPCDGGTSISAGLASALGILRGAGGRREILLITDLQANAWPMADDQAWRQVADELARPGAPALAVVDVAGGRIPDNVQIEAFAAADDIVTTDTPTAFTARLRNRGGVPATGVAVELWTDGAAGGNLRKAAATVVERLETVAEVRLETRLEPGMRRVEMRLTPDLLPADDVRSAVVEAVDKVRVLVVDGADGAAGGGAPFIRAALAPMNAQGDEAVLDAGPDLFRVDVIPPARLASTDLASYQAAVIEDADGPTPAVGAALRAWVAGGRGLILLPGPRARPGLWNDSLGALLPARLGAAPRDLPETAGTRGTGLATDRLVHPVVAFFASPETRPFLAQPRFWRAHLLETAEGASVVANFADGRPALVERGLGRGTVLMAAFSADRAWSDLPLRPAFLMLMRRAVQHTALGNRPRLTVRVHDALRLDLPAGHAAGHLEVTDPHGVRTILNPTLTPGGEARIEFTGTGSAGFYHLTGADRPWWFAATPGAEESDLTAIAPAEAGERLKPAVAVWAGSGEDATARIDKARAGVDIWPFLFALAVACLVAESILVARWAPKGT